MLTWLQANLASIVIGFVLLVIVSLIVRRLILDKKAGKHICGCSGCPMQGKCHSK